MSLAVSVNQELLLQWVASKREPQTIEAELHAMGFDSTSISIHLKEYRRLKHAKKQFTGFVCLALGAFLGFISCVLTIVNPIPELYNLVLFGLTSVAIGIICLGLYFVFE